MVWRELAQTGSDGTLFSFVSHMGFCRFLFKNNAPRRRGKCIQARNAILSEEFKKHWIKTCRGHNLLVQRPIFPPCMIICRWIWRLKDRPFERIEKAKFHFFLLLLLLITSFVTNGHKRAKSLPGDALVSLALLRLDISCWLSLRNWHPPNPNPCTHPTWCCHKSASLSIHQWMREPEVSLALLPRVNLNTYFCLCNQCKWEQVSPRWRKKKQLHSDKLCHIHSSMQTKWSTAKISDKILSSLIYSNNYFVRRKKLPVVAPSIKWNL